MKILFFIESLRSGGKERRLVELLKGLHKRYPEIKKELVLTRRDIHYTDVLELGIKIHVIERKGIKKDPLIFWKFYKIAKRYKPDIINVWGNMVAVYAIPTKILLKIPMVNNQITDAPLKVNNGLLSHKFTFLFSDKIIANTFAGLKAYNAPKNKSMVIYNGFDFDRITNLEPKESVRKKFRITTRYVIAMVASFSALKDYKTYILSAIDILKKRNDVTFLCIGSGNDTEFRSMIPNKYKNNILFLGRQENVESIINVCDIGVLTSNIYKHGEGISNALLEFSALRKPIIATDNGGNPELITNNKNGFLVNPFDYIELSKKLEILLNSEQRRKLMGNNSLKIVKRKFGIKRMIEEFYFIYNKFMD